MSAQAYLVNPGPSEGSTWLGYTSSSIPIQPGGLLFFRGTTQYLFTQDTDNTSTWLGVWKSTDGQNWTPLDQAHRPVIGGFTPRVWFPATDNICTCYYYDNGTGKEYVTTFNLSSGQFGTPLLTSYNTRDSGIIVRGNGDVILAYAQNPAPQHFYLSVDSGGSWTDIAVPALDGMAVLGLSLDKNDHVLILVGDGTGDQLNLVLFDGSTVTVTGVLAFSDNWTSLGPALYLPISDQLIVPIIRSDDGSGNEGLSILVITSASSVSPSASLVNVITDNSLRGQNWNNPALVAGASESDLILSWIATVSNPDNVVLQLTSADGGVSWGGVIWPAVAAPTTFYDPTVDHPVPDQGSPYTIAVLGTSRYQSALRTVLSFAVAPFSSEAYVITAPIPPAPTIPCNEPLRIYWMDQEAAGDPSYKDFQFIWTSKRTGVGTWSPQSKFYDMAANPPPGFVLADDFIDGFTAGQNRPCQGMPSVPIVLPLSSGGGATEQLYYIPGPGKAPVAIDPAGAPTIWNFFTKSQGPFYAQGAWWMIGYMGGFGSEFFGNPGPANMAVYKNTNAPSSWTSSNWVRMDQANEPGVNTAVFADRFDGTDTKLRFLVNTSGSGAASVFELVEFDMIAGGGSWGSVHDPVTPGTAARNISGMVYSVTSGVTTIFYNNSGTPAMAFLASGTWTIGITVGDGGAGFAGAGFAEAILDLDGTTLHTVYNNGSNLAYQQIFAGGVMGAVWHFAGQNQVPGHGLIFKDFDGTAKLALCCDYSIGSDLTSAVWIGSPLSSPAFPSTPELPAYYVGDIATCPYLVLDAPVSGGPYAWARLRHGGVSLHGRALAG